MNPNLLWLLAGVAVLFALFAIVDVLRSPTLPSDNHDGLSDEQREALRIIREQGE